MKAGKDKKLKIQGSILFWKRMFLALLILIVSGQQRAYAQSNQIQGYSLMVQQSPADAGMVTPDGVNRMGPDETIVLTATPHTGYQFVYWLGDVGDATNSETTITVNGPKLVIAVFERSEFSFQITESIVPSAGGGGARGRRFDSGHSAGGGRTPRDPPEWSGPSPLDPDPLPDDAFPVPDVNDDFPVPDEPIPEPATIALLGLGFAALIRERK